jgi:hypothetical protein
MQFGELVAQRRALEVGRITGGGQWRGFGGFTQVSQGAPDAGWLRHQSPELESATALGALFEAKIVALPVYQNLTIRNWNTTTKLLAVMESISG